MSEQQTHDRRAFLRGLVRWPAMAGLGALGACLATREGRPLQAGQRCIHRGLCRGCGALPACPLPQARLARKAAEITPGRPRF